MSGPRMIVQTAYLKELRRGPGLWLFPVLLAAGLIFAVSRLETLQVWPYTTAAAANSPYLLGPLVAGVAAWLGARAVRRGTVHWRQSSARDPVAAMAVDMLALATWVALAYLTIVGVLFGVTAGQASWGGPEWLWVVSAGAGLVALVPLGFLLGRAMPLRFTPMLVTMACFALFVLGDVEFNAAWERLLPVNVWSHDPFSDVLERPLYGQILWYLAVTVWVLVVLALLTRSGVRRLLAYTALAGVATAGGLFLLSGQGRTFSVTSQNRAFVCSTSRVELCVHPAFSASMPELQRRADIVAGRLSGTGFDVRRFEQQPRSVVGLAGEGAVAYAFDDAVPGHFDRAAYEMAMGAVNAGAACLPMDGHPQPGGHAMIVLITWAAGNQLDPAEPGRAAAWDWIRSQPEQVVREWIADHRRAISDCTLSYTDFRS